jgi:hypothetical protein
MAQIIVEVTEGTAASLAKLVRERMSAENGANTHGKLDVPGLLAMLAEDAAMVMERPGSWEGAAMGGLLASHGREV